MGHEPHRGHPVLQRLCLQIAALCFVGALVAGFCLMPVLALPLLVAIARDAQRWRGTGFVHGTARWAEYADALKRGFVGSNSGLILGRADHLGAPAFFRALAALFTWPIAASAQAVQLLAAAIGIRRGSSELLRIQRYVVLATVAPTGGGKGASVLVPNLLTYEGSAVVLDPKGELARLTARRREREFGHKIICIHPFWQVDSSRDQLQRFLSSFNPFDLTGTEANELLDDARALANAIIVRTGKEHEPYFLDAAEIVLTAIIADVLASAPARDRTLQTVREILCDPEAFRGTVKALTESEACGGMLRRLGRQLMRFTDETLDREASSVLATVHAHTAFLDSPAVAEASASGGFDPRTLRSGKVTVYLVMPPDQLQAQSRLMRLWLTALFRGLVKTGASEENPVLVFLDEVAQLGNLPVLEQALTLLRGYGVRLWFFFQSLGQVSDCFPEHKARTFLSNVDVLQVMGVNDLETAEMCSARLGETTLAVESFQESRTRPEGMGPFGEFGSEAGQYSSNRGITVSEVGRKLLKPEEVLQLPDQSLVFVRGCPPIRSTLVRYYADSEFREALRDDERPAPSSNFTGFLLKLVCVALIGFWLLYLVIEMLSRDDGTVFRQNSERNAFGSWHGPASLLAEPH